MIVLALSFCFRKEFLKVVQKSVDATSYQQEGKTSIFVCDNKRML